MALVGKYTQRPKRKGLSKSSRTQHTLKCAPLPQVTDKFISHAPFAGYGWPNIPWEALKLLTQAAVIVMLKQCLGAQGKSPP